MDLNNVMNCEGYFFIFLMAFESLLSFFVTLGPLHTRARSHAHEIARAQKKVSKGRPNTPPRSCCVVTDPQV